MSESLKNILKNILLKQDLVELQGLSNSSKALVLSLFLNKEISPGRGSFPIIIVCESFDVAEKLVRDIVPDLKTAGSEYIVEYPLNKIIHYTLALRYLVVFFND